MHFAVFAIGRDRFDQFDPGIALFELPHQFGCPVTRAAIDDDDLRDLGTGGDESFQARRQPLDLIEHGNDHTDRAGKRIR